MNDGPDDDSINLSRGTFGNLLYLVTPAKAGVQKVLKGLDSGFHRNDNFIEFQAKFKGPFTS